MIISKKYFLLPILIYTFLSVITIFSTGGLDNVNITTDFNHYHSFWHKYTNFNLSELSIDLYESNSKDQFFPNPIYSIIALFPIAIFGSPALLKAMGFILGCIYIFVF